MEILSDTVFKGSVRIENSHFSIGDVLNIEYGAMSEFGVQMSEGNVYAKTISLGCGSIKPYNSILSEQKFQKRKGTIALTYDCPKVLEKHLVAPADCTLFAVPSDGDFTNIFKNVGFATSVLSYRVDKVWHNGSCTLIDGCFWENTDIDVIMTNGNYNGCPFLIRKAAGLEMTEASYTNKTPGYKLVVTYL